MLSPPASGSVVIWYRVAQDSEFTRTAEQLSELWPEVGKKTQERASILKFGLIDVRCEVGVKPLKPVLWLKAS